MARRAKVWQGVAALFILGNIGAAGVAAAGSEGMHAMTHLALVLPAAWAFWRLGRHAADGERSMAGITDERLEQLQQSVDAVAIEVERIGESQRFSARLAAERVATPR